MASEDVIDGVLYKQVINWSEILLFKLENFTERL